MPSCLAIFAHPDDVEFYAAGTMLQLGLRGWDLHYLDLCAGNGGSVQMDGPTTATKRLAEAQEAARILGAKFYPPIVNDMTLTYDVEVMRKVASVIRQSKADIILTHALSDYMEDHMACARLAVSAAFTHGMPNFETVPPVPPYANDVTIYHAMPHGLRDPLRQKVRAGLYVDTIGVQDRAREALAAHASQKDWLDKSQGMDSYLATLDAMSLQIGKLSGKFTYAQGWRRHLHLGFSANNIDPLRTALGEDCLIDEIYEASLEKPLP
jgi:LmbE family N-acetylglucosaminyl deacetylase